MSLNENDRNFQSIGGKELPASPQLLSNAQVAQLIAQALRQGFGDARSSVKQVVQLTGANERAVRNWFEGKNAPSAEHLVNLGRCCDPVLEMFLEQCGHGELAMMLRAGAAMRQLAVMVSKLQGYLGEHETSTP